MLLNLKLFCNHNLFSFLDRFPYLNGFRAQSQISYHSFYIPESSVWIYLLVGWMVSSSLFQGLMGAKPPEGLPTSLFTLLNWLIWFFPHQPSLQCSGHHWLSYSSVMTVPRASTDRQIQGSPPLHCPLQMSVASPRLSLVLLINHLPTGGSWLLWLPPEGLVPNHPAPHSHVPQNHRKQRSSPRGTCKHF